MSEGLLTSAVLASDWNARVAAIRKIETSVAPNEQLAVFARLAQDLFVPQLTYDFAHVQWPDDYEGEQFAADYAAARELTRAFRQVEPRQLAAAMAANPRVLRVLRLICGYTRPELAEASALAIGNETGGVSSAVIRTMETGGASRSVADACAKLSRTVDQVVRGELFPPDPTDESMLRTKQQKADTAAGWASVRDSAEKGVSYDVLLHQRLYGGAFRQIADASSSRVGRVLEDPVIELLELAGIDFIRTTSSKNDKSEVSERFGITLSLVPDFVIYKGTSLRAFLECKMINDGGTARDKAARFTNYRHEGMRLGGVPVIAVVDGAGWRRTQDALGPVIKACDGRVFTRASLHDLLSVEPLASLRLF